MVWYCPILVYQYLGLEVYFFPLEYLPGVEMPAMRVGCIEGIIEHASECEKYPVYSLEAMGKAQCSLEHSRK